MLPEMKKFAVILAGCGTTDGSEIHESVMTLYAIARHGASYHCFAPDIKQHHVVNHFTGKEMAETRNVLVESARIARGNIRPLQELEIRSFDAVVFPGGFGVAKNLCTYAFEGADCKVNPQVAEVIREAVTLRKPIGALCIAPVMLAKVIGDVEITLGQDSTASRAAEKMGAHHKPTTHGQVIIDSRHKLFTTPCYMLDATIVDIANDADSLVKAMLEVM